MKLITIIKDVTVTEPGGATMPEFKQGQEARVSDRIADLLVKRKLARYAKGLSRTAVKKAKGKKKKEDVVKKEIK